MDRMTALYICYQSLLDPLTQTQVVAYLEGLARGGYRVVLLTFEPRPLKPEEVRVWRDRLGALGVTWQWCRYHKRPTVPATLFDVAVGVAVGWWLVRKYGVRLVHARAHVPGLMALGIRLLTRTRFLFDVRGFMAEEYADAGVWRPGGILFRWTKRVERVLVRSADGIVVLTEQARRIFRGWYPRELRGKPLEVIPCCVDFRRLPTMPPAAATAPPALAYAGKLGGWYLTDEMAGFVAAAAEQVPDLRWRVWTQSDGRGLVAAARAAGVGDRLEVGYLPPDELAAALTRVRAGLAFIKPSFSKRASSATKVGEYLVAGLPVVATAGVGDTDEILARPRGQAGPVGVLVDTFTSAAYRAAARDLLRLLDDPGTAARCKAVAREYYHLEDVGWPRYRRLYQVLLGGGMR